MKRSAEKQSQQYSPEEIAQMEKSRAAADITTARVNSFEDLNAETKEQGDEVFNKKTRELWKEFAVHGIIGENKEGEQELKRFSDLDGKFSLELLRLAGIDTRDVEYVKPGEHIRGRINLDTGNRSGLVVEDEGKTAFFDHHGRYSKNDSSATKVTYETLVSLGLLKNEPFLDRAVEFVTQVDNKTFPNEEKYFRDSYRTVLGLQRFIKPDKLVEFFKQGGDPIKNLSNEELKKLGLERGSGRQKEDIEKSVERIKEMQKQGMIVDSQDYGKIVVDIGKTIPSGFDAIKAEGCGMYINWSPERNSFFISSVNDLRHNLSQGKQIRQTMWIKPRQDTSDLNITLQEILSTFTDGKFKPKGELKKYLNEEGKEKIDSFGDNGRINKNKESLKNMPRSPEIKQDPEQKKERFEINPFQEMESKTAESFTDRYAETSKIDKDVKDGVEGLLSRETEKKQHDFALAWFSKNEGELKKRGIVTEGTSDDWKVNMALTSKEKGGLGLLSELNKGPDEIDPQFKEIRQEMDRISILRADTKKDKTPPETPFLLLNHLQKSIENGKTDIDRLKTEGKNEEAASKEKELKDIRKWMEVISIKVTGKDLRAEAIKEVKGLINVEKEVDKNIDSETLKVKKEKEKELLKKEWQSFSGLSPKEQKAYLHKMGHRGPITEGDFYREIVDQAKDNPESFYGLLGKEYKPHLKNEKRTWYKPWEKKVFIPIGKGEREMSADKYNTEKEFAGKGFKDEAEKLARERLEKIYQDKTDEEVGKLVNERIEELAKSPEAVEGGIEAVYKKAKERLVQEFIKSQLENAPKTKKQLEAIQKKFGVEGKEIDAIKLMNDVLANADGFGEDINSLTPFLQEHGMDLASVEPGLNGFEKAYSKARKTKEGILSFILRLMVNPTRRPVVRQKKAYVNL